MTPVDARIPPPTLRVYIVVGVRMYRDGLAAGLAARDGVTVVGTAANVRDAAQGLAALTPDIVIVDVGTRGSLDFMRSLRQSTSSIRTLAFAVEEDTGAIMECAEAGAWGYVTAEVSLTELVQAIRSLAREELSCSPRVASQLFRRLAERGDLDPASPSKARRLTSRERQVLTLIRQGRSNKEIASALQIAEPTVKNHVHHVLEKLAVENRTQAVAALRPSATQAAHRGGGP